jgi:transcriptional regulator with XRE-family HTH domain
MKEMSQKLYKAFCENVAERLRELNMTRAQLAEQMDVDRSYVSIYLNGHRQPGFDVVEAFAKHLKVEPSDLLRNLSKTG